MSIARAMGRTLLLALTLALAALLMTAAAGVVGAQPALADDGDDGGGDDDDDGRGDDGGGDDDARAVGGRGDDDGGGDDDAGGRGDDDAVDRGGAKDRAVPVGGVQTGAGGMAGESSAAPLVLAGVGLLVGGGLIASRLRSATGGPDA